MKVSFVLVPYEVVENENERYIYQDNSYHKVVTKTETTTYSINEKEIFDFEESSKKIWSEYGLFYSKFYKNILGLVIGVPIALWLLISVGTVFLLFLRLIEPFSDSTLFKIVGIATAVFLMFIIPSMPAMNWLDARKKELIKLRDIDKEKVKLFSLTEWNNILKTNPSGILTKTTTNQFQVHSPYSCSNCNKTVPPNSMVGDRCPHCGGYWGGRKTIY